MAEETIPANYRAILERLAEEVELTPGGRIELIFDEKLSLVDGYKKPRNDRLDVKALEALSVFCSCLINTSTVRDLCVVCSRPKRPAPSS